MRSLYVFFLFIVLSGFSQKINLVSRFNPPEGFQRIAYAYNSFGSYLRNVPLKPTESKVHLYDGTMKGYQGGAAAVLDIDVGDRDLQQCADAVMRLRAEYLFAEEKYDEIHFNLTNGFRVDFSQWAAGFRVKVEGNKTWWVHTAKPSKSYATFRRYLNFVFAYAGTLSLSKELKSVALDDLQAGDVFIQGGSPGHAVLVMDVAELPASGEKVFLLAQSYMPAQDIHVLKNLNRSKISPWYSVKELDKLYTPEWTFSSTDLKRFP